MKTLYTTYNNFAKRLVMSLMVLMTVGVGGVFAAQETLSGSFTSSNTTSGGFTASEGTAGKYYKLQTGYIISDASYSVDATKSISVSMKVGTFGNYSANKQSVDFYAVDKNGNIISNTVTASFSKANSSGATFSGTVTLNSGNSGNDVRFKFASNSKATSDVCARFYEFTITYESAPSTFTVTYDDNGATSGTVPIDGNEYESGTAVTVLGNTGDLVKTGYRFDGWQIDKAGTVYNAGGTFNISEHTTLYAKWTARTFTNYRTSCGSAATLVSIAVSGQTTTYNVGDSFSFDGTCTATYDDESTKTVTPTSVSSPDMSTAGTKTVTVTYTEGDVTVTTTYEIVVNVVKTATSLTWSADSYTATIASPSNLFPTLTINPEAIKGSVTYYSSHPEYATIDANGNIILKSAGETTITASYAGDEDYAAAEDTYTLIVEESDNCRWEEVTINDIEYGDEVVIAVGGTDANGEAILYMLQDPQEAANPKVYQMNVNNLMSATNLDNTLIWNIRKRDDNNDNFTIYKKGSTTDRLAFISGYGVRVGGNYADSIFTLISEKYIQSISSNEYLRMSSSNDWRHYSTNTAQSFVFYKKVCLPSNVSRVTYSVSAGDTAPEEQEVVNNTSITLPSIETTLTCVNFVGWTDAASGYTHGTDKLYKASDSYTVTENVTLHAVYAAGGGYVLVTDEANLAAGDKVIIVATDYNVAMGADRGNNRGQVEVTKDGNTISNIGESQILTLEAGTKSETFAFNTGSGYLYAASSGSNYLKTQANNSDNGSWTISINSESIATIKAQGSYTRNWLRYNSGSSIFSCYASGQADVSIYKEDVAGYTTDPECVTYSVSACDNLTNGTITIEKTTIDPYGSTNVTFVPNNGYMLESVIVTPSNKATVQEFTADVTGNRTLKISNIQSDIEVCATFKAIPYYKVTFIDMNADPQTSTEVFQSEFGGNITAPQTTNSEPCSAEWTFIGWAPSNELNGTTDIPANFVEAGGTISGANITSNLVYYSVYSNSSDGTPPFSIGKSGTYYMYALDGTTKYYATTNRNGNALYAGEEESNDFNTYPKAKVKLTYNSNTNKYKIQITTFGNNPTDGYLYHPDATKQDITHNSLENYTEFTLQKGSASGYNIVYNYTVQQLQGNVYVPVVRTGCFGKSNSYFNASTTITDVYFEPASEMHYYNASDCPDDYVTMSFHNPFVESGVQLTYEDGYEEDYYKNTSKKNVDVFPTLEYAGWTFIGWTAGSSYNDDISEENLNDENSSASAPTQDIYKTGGGLSYYLDGEVTMYPVFTKFEDNEPFDMVNGGDYYIYYIADGDIVTSVDEYGAAHRIYAGGWGSGGTSNSYGSTQSCASATLFTFTKLSNGKWSIYDNTKGKYLCAGATDNNLALNTTTATYGEWTITVYNGNQVNAVSRDGYTLSAYSQDAVTGTFKNYATSNFNNNSAYYHRVYVGTCTERVYSSSPTNKLTVTWNPNGGQWGDGTTFSKTETYDKGASITAPDDPTREGYTFAGWQDQNGNTSVAVTMPDNDLTYTAQWTANTNTAYKVEHYQEALDGSYTLVETEALTGTTDATVTPSVKTYEGFTSPAKKTVTILADGSLVVKYQYTRNSYQLTWDLNGGTETAAGTPADLVKFGAPLTAPTVEKTGYTFAGWDPGVPATMPAENMTYKATWNVVTYNITYTNLQGATHSNPATYTVEDAITFTAPTARIGYTFAGWTPAGISAGTTGDQTVEAQWTANTNTPYKVEHYQEALDGSYTLVETDALTGTTDATVTPSVKTYEGFTSPANKTVTILADGSLVVKYQYTRNSYQLTWDLNGGTTIVAGTPAGSVKYGAQLTAPKVERVGYTFVGWDPAVPATMPAENITYTALWTANTNTPYVVEHYQQNLDLSYPTTPTEKESFTGTTDTKVTPTVKTYEGFTSPATQEVTIAADGRLVVRYEYKRNSYQLTWDLAGGTITAAGTAAGSVLFGAEIKAPRVAKVDNVFMGWKPEVPATMPASDATYVAQWIELTNFRTFCKNSVTWVVNGGKWADGTTADIVDIYTRGQEIIPPTDPTLDGWKFMGWDPEFVAGTTMQGNDHIYTAQWAKAYTVTYDANGSDTTCEDNNEYVANDIVTVCNSRPTKAGYTFAGWMRSDNNAIVQPDATFAMPATDVTLIAQWTPNTDTKYVVEHYQQNLDGTYPTTPTEREELAGTTDTQVTPAVKAYAGFTAPAPQTAIIAATGTLVVKYEYTRNSYNLAWDLNGGTITTEGTAAGSIKFGAPITAPVVEKVGHNFEGWEDQDGNPVTITTMPSEDATYKAIWHIASHTVTWDPAGGHWDGDHNKKVETYEYGAEIVKPANPEKTGYAFIGWQPEVEEIMQNSNLTYTAQWGEEFCENYSFHWGSGTEDQVRNDNHQACFTQKDDTHEWQVTHFTIPEDTKYFVGLYGWWYWSDLGVGDSNGQKSKSVMKEWTWTGDQVMYLAHVGRGYTLGHAVGAVGTLRIYDNTSLDNLDVAFIPNGYGITLTSISSGAKTPYAFRTTTVDHKWETDVLNLPGITNNKYTVGLATQVDGEYVESHHSETKALEKIGITEIVEGKKVVYFKPGPWNTDNAVFAVWDGTNSKWGDDTNKFLTDTDNDGVYQGYVSSTCKKINFVRLSNGTTATNIDWNRKWNQTNDISLATDQVARVYTITGWNETDYTETNASPKTDTNGKFRMWDNSTNKNWFVHFVPYYLLSYDPNGGEGTMPATEYNTEDANKNVTVSDNGFTHTGYDFVAWNTKADGKGTSYQPGDAYTMTGDATLYAIWNAQTYNIAYKDQGDDEYSGENSASLPKTHTYDKKTTLVDGVKTGYTFEGWYDTPECDGTAITELGAKDYTADITLYAKWTFAMEYDITNTETIYITSAKKQTVKATTQLTLQVGNMPVGTTIDIAAPHITFYDEAGKSITQLTTKYNPETFSLAVAYTPEDENTTEQPTITLSVLGREKAFDIISARSLPATFAIVAKVGNLWYALPSQGLSSTSDLVGYPVEVDNQDDPTEVRLIPTNADWSLYGVYQSSGSNDRFAANGSNILFVNGEAKALNASRTDGYVLTDAKYDSYQNTTSPDLYEWIPTTTDLETYQLSNANRKDRKLSIDILTRFGVYKGEIENLRFLPIQGRYTQATFQVVEWKENSLVIMYNGNPAQIATIAIDGTTNIGSANLSDVNKDFAIYELPADGLVNNATKRILITIGTEQKWLTVPYIISGEKTDAEVVASTSADIVTATDVFILKGAKFSATATSQNSQCRFRNVTVYGGGKLVIGSGTFLSMNSIILRAGGITDAGEYDYVYPQFDLQGTLTNSAGEFKYDYITDYEHWYHLVLPFDGKIKSPSIKYPVEFYGNNVSATNSGSWVVKRYDGATRATGNYEAWVDIESENADVITAGHGYIYWGAPKKVKVNGEEKRQQWGIQRIVMKTGWEAARNAEKGDKTVSGLGSYANVDNNSGNVYDQGWNLIGNPYMVNLTGLNSKSLKTGKLIEERDANDNWTGGWVLDSINATLRYITVPSDHFEWYTAEKVSKNMTLVAGRAFFVQIDGTATDVMFEAANRAQLMPALRAAHNDEPVDIETGIVLSNETLQDEVNFWIADGMTNDYEYNADYPKTPNNNNFNIYGVHTNGHLSWVATGPEFAKESMPIGYQVPDAGTYMLSVSEEYYSDEIDALYVTDHEMSPEVTIDLMSAPYDFSVNQAETNDKRFTVSIKLKKASENDATGLDNININGEEIQKFIYQDKMYILHHGIIYDATGKRVITINK